jgi:hypothetical protein
MKRFSVAFAAWMILGQLAGADDTATGGSAMSASSLPFPVPASARNAAEAPRWDEPVAGATSNAQKSNVGPSDIARSPQGSSNSDAGAIGAIGSQFPAESTDGPRESKPLQSVMKRRPGEMAPNNGIAQATYNGPVVTGGAAPITAEAAGAATSQTGVPNSSPVAQFGANPPGLFPGNQAAGIAHPAAASPIPNANRTLTATQAQPAAAPAVRQTAIDPEKLAAAKAAAELLASSIDNGTAGTTPLRLLNVVTQAAESDRSAVIREYWNLARAWSDYRWAIDEAKRLEVVVPARGAVDAPMLSTARAAAAARVNDAQLIVESAQAALMRTARLAPQTGLYFPTDAPLVGPYQTYFSVLFAGRAAPGRTWQIDRMLPIRLKTINDRTAAVQSAASAVHYAEEAHARGEVDMRTVLACHDDLHRQRRDFLNAVNDYNVEIAEYAATVAGNAAPDRLVAMLIHVKPDERVSALPGRAGGAIQLPPPPNVAGNGAGTNSRNPANSRVASPSGDGWVPSPNRSADLGVSTTSQPAQGTLLPGSGGGAVDPFYNPR